MWVLNVSYKYRRRTVCNVQGRGIGMRGFGVLFLNLPALETLQVNLRCSMSKRLVFATMKDGKSQRCLMFATECSLGRTSAGQDDPIHGWALLSPACRVFAVRSSGSKRAVRVRSPTCPFAAPAQGKLKSFGATEQPDLDLLPDAERNLPKLVWYFTQIIKHLSSETEKPLRGTRSSVLLI